MELTTCTHIHVFVQSWFSLFRHLIIWYNRDKPFYLTLNSSSTLYVLWLQVRDTPGKNTYVKVEHDFFIVTRSNEHKNKLFLVDTWQWLMSLDKLGAGGARNTKSKLPPLVVIFFLPYVYWSKGPVPTHPHPQHPPGLATRINNAWISTFVKTVWRFLLWPPRAVAGEIRVEVTVQVCRSCPSWQYKVANKHYYLYLSKMFKSNTCRHVKIFH